MPAGEMPPRAGKGARKRGGAGHGAQGPSLPPRTQLIGLELPPGRGRRAGPRRGGGSGSAAGAAASQGKLGRRAGPCSRGAGSTFWARAAAPALGVGAPPPRSQSPSRSPAAAERREVPGPAAAGSRAPRSRSRAARALPWMTAGQRGAQRGRPCPTRSRAPYGASSTPFTCQLLGKLKSHLGGASSPPPRQERPFSPRGAARAQRTGRWAGVHYLCPRCGR
ncbi:translation initiation factor IF-2-like isoform X2 [Trachypithecus francoisi]|uniref:translation initiation factor IF-2-like isoform X2 n=1 Tax=Trachypithecus francoisi TaxID=54180 RepID=UPI00141B2128|nr:translation initiation factor IF-2-like isoform X2 [Trachypithecus francoisi]